MAKPASKQKQRRSFDLGKGQFKGESNRGTRWKKKKKERSLLASSRGKKENCFERVQKNKGGSFRCPGGTRTGTGPTQTKKDEGFEFRKKNGY